MVFATEFDPIKRSGHPNALSAVSDTSKSVSAAQTVVISTSNVVALQPEQPLKLGKPAVRVRTSDRSISLPKKAKLPLGLTLLNRLQQSSAVVTGLLVAGALIAYGSTVYVDKSTSHALVQLDALQGESQQLTSANESIKQSLAEQAIQEDSGLEPYESGDVLFLKPEPLRKNEVVEAEASGELIEPLGY